MEELEGFVAVRPACETDVASGKRSEIDFNKIFGFYQIIIVIIICIQKKKKFRVENAKKVLKECKTYSLNYASIVGVL